MKKIVWFGGIVIALVLTAFSPKLVMAQWPFAAPTTPDAQRNALSAVRSQVNWLQRATRTAPSYVSAGYGNLYQQFEALRGAYNGLTQTLSPQQLAQGANDLAELSAGLGIIQEAFSNYQEAVAAGQPENTALREMCQILREASQVWLQELNSRVSKLRIGWG
jgi:hypothetical protein